jgi:hypothetical protein
MTPRRPSEWACSASPWTSPPACSPSAWCWCSGSCSCRSAKQKWYAARIEDEQLAHDTEVKRLKEKGPPDAVTKKEDEWRKRKERLETDVQWVQINNRQSEYWDRYGMLGGFVLTALGAIGLLMTHQPTVKKIVGAVVVCGMMILVFINFAWKG